MDNGAIRFTHVRVPRDNLLDRFASVDRSGALPPPPPSSLPRLRIDAHPRLLSCHPAVSCMLPTGMPGDERCAKLQSVAVRLQRRAVG